MKPQVSESKRQPKLTGKLPLAAEHHKIPIEYYVLGLWNQPGYFIWSPGNEYQSNCPSHFLSLTAAYA